MDNIAINNVNLKKNSVRLDTALSCTLWIDKTIIFSMLTVH